MIVQFARWGNSIALRIPNAFAKELQASPGRCADLSIQNGALVVTPVEAPRYTLDELLDGMTEENLHGEIATGPAVGNEFS
jgi:antitoxin MazE